MKLITKSAQALVRASKGSPFVTTVTVIVFHLMFIVLVSQVEKLLFGEPFEHFLDPIFTAVFIGYAALAVYHCAVHNTEKRTESLSIEEVEDFIVNSLYSAFLKDKITFKNGTPKPTQRA